MTNEQSYLAECLWPSVTRPQVSSVARRAQAASDGSVRYLGSILMPEDEVVFFQFAATSADEVARVCREIRLPFDRILASEHVSAR